MATDFRPSPGPNRRPGPGWDVRDSPRVGRRAFLFCLVIFGAFALLIGRLYFLQVVRGEAYAARAQANRLTRIPIAAPRGIIVDRRGVVLATSRTVHEVSVVPAMLPSARREAAERAQILGTLAFLLDLSVAQIEESLESGRHAGARPVDPIVIAGDVDLATVTRLEEHRVRLSGAIAVSEVVRRFYPQGALGAHLLGYTGVANADDLERARGEGTELARDEAVGKNGLERRYDAFLRGQRGARIWEVDARHRPVRERTPIAPRPGATLELGLDFELQRAAELGLRAARGAGAVVAIDPRDGQVLALASNPGFDPNIFSLAREEFGPAYDRLVSSGGNPLLNRAASSRFPPASTFKMISALAGLEAGVAGRVVSCPGHFVHGRRFGCWATHGGGIDLANALAGSCNVFFYDMALRLGQPSSTAPEALARAARRLGLGERTGIDLPSEAAGLVPDPAWRARLHADNTAMARWQPGSTLNMSIGQGDLLASPLQMATATAALASGVWRQPRLVRRATSADGRDIALPSPAHRTIDFESAHLAIVRQGLREVVTRGTGRGADLAHVAVAGKTGSAQDANNPLPHSWWVCFAPFENPTIAIAVIVENAGSGSANALPIGRQMLEVAFPQPAPENDDSEATG